MRDKLTLQSVPEDVKKKVLDEIVKDFFFKPKFSLQAITQVKGKDDECVIETGAIQVWKAEEKGKVGCCSQSSIDYQYCDHDSVVYLNDVQEFKSLTKQGMDKYCVDDQDQRFFMFTSNLTMEMIRQGSESRVTQFVEDVQHENCYSYITYEPYYFNMNGSNDGVEVSKCRAVVPYVRDATRLEMEMKKTEICESNSLKPENNKSISPKHVHPKLPDYDEIAAMFRALKKLHQLTL